jgi:hypothetical protein
VKGDVVMTGTLRRKNEESAVTIIKGVYGWWDKRGVDGAIYSLTLATDEP